MAFESTALTDRDVAAGTLMVKIAERRATLLGLNPPLGHDEHVPARVARGGRAGAPFSRS